MRNITTLAVIIALALPLVASAEPVTFSFSEGSRAASATFTSSGGNLIITFTNTSAYNVLQPDQLLTGLFFDVYTNPTLTPGSAILTAGSQVLFNGSQPAGGDVGGEWAFRSDLSGAPGDASYGLSATGLGLFGPHDRFNDNSLNNQANVGGMDFGIVSAGYNQIGGNKPVTGHNPLIDNSVTFTLEGYTALLNPQSSITNVTFQYGTSLAEPSFGGGGGGGGGGEIPEPGTAALLLLGSAYMIRKARNRRKLA